MSINEVKERIEILFRENGNYITIYRLDDNYDWVAAFKTAEQDFTSQEVEILINKFMPSTETDCIEIETKCFVNELCEVNGYKLKDWVSDWVFESCGYDLCILTFIISNDSSNSQVISYHNQYERF